MTNGLSLRLNIFWCQFGPLTKWASIFLLLLLLSLIMPSFLFVDSAARIRCWGMLLQFWGLANIVWAFNRKRSHFGHKTVHAEFFEWIKRNKHLLKLPNPVNIQAQLMEASDTLDARLFLGRPWQHTSPDDRLAALERAVDDIDLKLHNLKGQSERTEQQFDKEIKRERTDREQSDATIIKGLETISIGDNIDWAGVTYLFFGIGFASMPEWIVWVVTPHAPNWLVWFVQAIRL